MVQMLDDDIQDAKALVIDSNATSRSTLMAQLRDLGVGTVLQSSRAQDARRHLESTTFDLVVCDYHFDKSEYSGRDLLDDLRRAQLLPYATVFIMVTAEATYSKVAEAAESSLDGYLLRPYSAAALFERLATARHRKKTLKTIFDAVEAGEFETAAELCLARFNARDQYWLFAARIGAELLLRVNRHAEAKTLFQAVAKEKAAPWARLGIARAELEGQEVQPAKRTLESLIADQPTYADAYDVMGRVMIEQGEFAEALETYKRASEITPGSINRLQKQGLLAFYMGARDESAKALERAVTLGSTSKMFDYQTHVLLCFIRFVQKDDKGLQRSLDELRRALEKVPESARLRRFLDTATILSQMRERQLGAAIEALKRLVPDIRSDDFDLEAACNMLTLLAHLREAEVDLADATIWVDTLGKRFCVSKVATDMLSRAAFAHPPYQEIINASQVDVTSLAEKAMNYSIEGDPGMAVKQLIEHSMSTLNARYVEMAALALQRHRAKITDQADLQQQIAECRKRFAAGSGRLPIDQFDKRPAGGLSLRVNTAPKRSLSVTPAAAAPAAAKARP